MQNKLHLNTFIILSIGYFIDFYDLSIFSVHYSKIIPDLFGITNEIAIQLLYLKISNFYNIGIFIGCILFGILGDKYGRISVIKFSILLYSITIFMSIFVHNIIIFTFLRFLSGVGLSTEFSTSAILISELLYNSNKTNANIFILYISGILGGITATFIGWFSWKFMFLFGSICGILLYILRSNIIESTLYVNIKNHICDKGNIIKIINNRKSLSKIIKLLVLSIPFYFMISVMFIIPKFIHLNLNLAQAIHKLLIYFFIGNIIGTILATILIKQFQNYKIVLYITILLYAITIFYTKMITYHSFSIYCLLLGITGGSFPVTWIQLVINSFGINQRSTATNLLTALGRGSTVIYNILISLCLNNNFFNFLTIITIIMTIVFYFALFAINDNYHQDIDYIQS